MPAAVEKMMFVGETPWHGLGNKVDDGITVNDAIVEAGLDWEVGLKDLQRVTSSDTLRSGTQGVAMPPIP